MRSPSALTLIFSSSSSVRVSCLISSIIGPVEDGSPSSPPSWQGKCRSGQGTKMVENNYHGHSFTHCTKIRVLDEIQTDNLQLDSCMWYVLLKVFIQCYILDHVAVEHTLIAFQILFLISEITTYSNCGYVYTHTSVSSVWKYSQLIICDVILPKILYR